MIKTGKDISSWQAIRTFMKVGSCSEAMCNVLNRAYDQPLETEENAAMPLAGGIMQQGYQCGLIWGAALAAGAQAYRQYGPGPEAETMTIRAAQKVMGSFLTHSKDTNCFEITEVDWRVPKEMRKFMLKGGPIRCFRRAGRAAPLAHRELKETFDGDPVDAPEGPVSCAAELIRKLGGSELHQTMASGFAGGIGLSGGGCGALGAAIWLHSMKNKNANDGKLDYNDPKLKQLVEEFAKQSGFEYECEKIVGRRFTDTSDHAEYLRQGGCAELMKKLAEDVAAGPAKPESPNT
ncbi:C-GCAxxG-C-C family protein [bacterium]|nr:C-GCAxxG-C-C family protein [bacterium]